MRHPILPLFLSLFFVLPLLADEEVEYSLLQDILDRPNKVAVPKQEARPAVPAGKAKEVQAGKDYSSHSGTGVAAGAVQGQAESIARPDEKKGALAPSLPGQGKTLPREIDGAIGRALGPSASTGEKAALPRRKYVVIRGGKASIDHRCMPLLYRGDYIDDRNDFSEELDGSGWQLACDFHYPVWSSYDLDASLSYTMASIDEGTIFHDNERKAFDDSDCTIIQGHLLLQRSFRPIGNIRPYLGAGAQFFKSQIDYDRGISYWYWTRSRKISRRERESDGGTIDDTEIAPCINAGVELSYQKLLVRADISYTPGMKDIWRGRDSDDEENLVLSLNGRYDLSDRFFLEAEVGHFKATAVKSALLGMGMYL